MAGRQRNHKPLFMWTNDVLVKWRKGALLGLGESSGTVIRIPSRGHNALTFLPFSDKKIVDIWRYKRGS